MTRKISLVVLALCGLFLLLTGTAGATVYTFHTEMEFNPYPYYVDISGGSVWRTDNAIKLPFPDRLTGTKRDYSGHTEWAYPVYGATGAFEFDAAFLAGKSLDQFDVTFWGKDNWQANYPIEFWINPTANSSSGAWQLGVIYPGTGAWSRSYDLTPSASLFYASDRIYTEANCHFNLTKVALDIRVSDNPVPEPATLLLVGGGLLGMGARRIRAIGKGKLR